MIIRLYKDKDHFAVVVIAATPPGESGSVGMLVPSISVCYKVKVLIVLEVEE